MFGAAASPVSLDLYLRPVRHAGGAPHRRCRLVDPRRDRLHRQTEAAVTSRIDKIRVMRKYLRRMRTTPILDALFPEVRSGILQATFLQPERAWFLTELASFLNTRPSSLQREIDALSVSGILRTWRDGRRLYVQADRQCPIFEDLQRLLEKTGGLAAVLQQEFVSLHERIQTAFVFGSVARSAEQSQSDIDLLVVGDLGLKDLQPILEQAEERLGRQINPIVDSAAEFRSRLQQHDHFLTTVMASPRLLIAGEDRELAAVA